MKSYIQNLEKFFESKGDKAIAKAQEQYMRNRYSFFGLKTPERKSQSKAFIQQYGLPDFEERKAFVEAVFQSPYREVHYFGVGFIDKNAKKLIAADIDLCRYMIEKSDWWDIVDTVSPHFIGILAKKYPEIKELMKVWIRDENFWIRRSAILFQLGYRNETDFEMLSDFCVQCSHEKEFFIQKAMGWALREHAKRHKNEVDNFLNNHTLPNLTVREAKKHFK